MEIIRRIIVVPRRYYFTVDRRRLNVIGWVIRLVIGIKAADDNLTSVRFYDFLYVCKQLCCA